jgi:hypothetical protein
MELSINISKSGEVKGLDSDLGSSWIISESSGVSCDGFPGIVLLGFLEGC